MADHLVQPFVVDAEIYDIREANVTGSGDFRNGIFAGDSEGSFTNGATAPGNLTKKQMALIMKPCNPLVLIAMAGQFLLAGCSGRNGNEENSELSIFRGTWIDVRYAEEVHNRRPASEALAVADDGHPAVLIFSRVNASPFSFGVLYNPHQAGKTNEVIRFSTADSSYDVGSADSVTYKLRFSAEHGDTILVMKGNGKNKYVKKFRRLSREPLPNPYSFCLQKFAFEGWYDVLNPAKKIVVFDVHLGDDGKVTRFRSLVQYSAEADSEDKDDRISFTDDNNRKKFFSYAFQGQDIYLYELVSNAAGAEQPGDLKMIFHPNK